MPRRADLGQRGPKRGWFTHLRRDPRVTLLVLDPKNMFRWAQIQGRLAGSTADGAPMQLYDCWGGNNQKFKLASGY